MKNRFCGISGAAVLAVVAGAGPAVRASDLSNNLAKATGGSETASGTRWLSASFGAGAAGHTLNSVTLLMAQTAPGTAEVQLRADGGLEPGALIATLNGPGSIPGTLTATSFTTPGIALTAGATYWIVLRPVSGSYSWAWSSESTGTGEGFKFTWGVSEDSGLFWWTQNRYPTQFSVVVDQLCAADLNGDGLVDFADYLEFLNLFEVADPRVDYNEDGQVDFADYLEFLNHYDAGC